MQSYLLLQPAAPDPSIAVLQQISSQLASFSIQHPFVNSTQPSSTTRANANAPPPVPRWAVWLNALWFSGLILSLSSASVGIMVKQWLNEYSSGASGTSRPVARVRQYRLNNLRTWRVEDIIGTIPILLQLALALFLSGMLILLWTLHDTVAAIASTLVSLLAIFTVVTTLLPLLNPKCSYLTPQIRAVNAAWQPKRYAYWVCDSMLRKRCGVTAILTSTQHKLSTFCRRIRAYVSVDHWRSLWLRARDTTRQLRSVSFPPETWKESKKTWQGQERWTIDELARGLDTQTLVEAYSTTLSPNALSAASVCLMDFYVGDVVDYFQQLHKSAREHFGPAADSDDSPLVYGNQQWLLWLHIILCVSVAGTPPLSDDEAAALTNYFLSGFPSSGVHAADAEWAVSACNAFLDDFAMTGTLFEESDHLAITGTSFAEKFIGQYGFSWAKIFLIDSAMGHEKPLTNVLLPGEIILSHRALHALMPYPDKVLPGHTAMFVSGRRRPSNTLIRGTCKVSTTSWRAPITP